MQGSFKSIWFTALLLLLVLTVTAPLRSGLRGPGKYSGVVVFDRWDTCFLLSGPYLTYISDAAKEILRPYTGKAVQIEATRVFQPINPGDALIREYKILGPTPVPKWLDLRDVSVRLDPTFQTGAPAFRISFRNTSNTDVWVRTDQIGVTVLGEKKGPHGPSDGRSEAVITRSPLSLRRGGQEWSEDGQLDHAYYARQYPTTLPTRIQVMPQALFEANIRLDISPGEYQILIGYGGGVHEEESKASNAVAFRVESSGLAILEPE